MLRKTVHITVHSDAFNMLCEFWVPLIKGGKWSPPPIPAGIARLAMTKTGPATANKWTKATMGAHKSHNEKLTLRLKLCRLRCTKREVVWSGGSEAGPFIQRAVILLSLLLAVPGWLDDSRWSTTTLLDIEISTDWTESLNKWYLVTKEHLNTGYLNIWCMVDQPSS